MMNFEDQGAQNIRIIAVIEPWLSRARSLPQFVSDARNQKASS
jgi:hypothetical protein